jgi:hypothetical protein
MSKVDEELTRRLRRAQRPVDVEGVFDSFERRRSHRERVRRVQAGLLAFAVLATTASVFVALRDAFGGGGRDVGESPVLAGNGEIVFSAEGGDGYSHLYAMQPDGSGRRQITDFGTHDTDPAVSPDGRTIAFVHQLEDVNPVIATIPIEGGTVTWQSSEALSASDPAWSPDGTSIAFVGRTSRWSVLYVMRMHDVSAPLTSRLDVHTAEPTWSPDGTRIAFALRGSAGPWGLASIRPDGTGLEPVRAPEGDEDAPAWSPDGSRIAFMRAYEGKDGIWTMPAAGGDARLVGHGVDLEHELAWAPDGSALLVSDGEWIFRLEATPSADAREDLVRLGKGDSPTWQPLPAGPVPPTPEPEPSTSPSPDTGDADIGLDFRLCHMSRLEGVDFLGDGAFGNAWVGIRVRENGSCPEQVEPRAVVAADFNGDEIADSWWGGIEYCLFCEPADAVDLDADGDEELIVVESRSSTPSFLVLTAVRDGDGRPQLRPVLVAAPGHEAAGKIPGQPLRISVGGDEGYSAWVRCEHFPAAPVLILTWRDHPIEGNTMEIHETSLVLDDDVATVVDATDETAPVGSDIPGLSEAPACGVDWLVWD